MTYDDDYSDPIEYLTLSQIISLVHENFDAVVGIARDLGIPLADAAVEWARRNGRTIVIKDSKTMSLPTDPDGPIPASLGGTHQDCGKGRREKPIDVDGPIKDAERLLKLGYVFLNQLLEQGLDVRVGVVEDDEGKKEFRLRFIIPKIP